MRGQILYAYPAMPFLNIFSLILSFMNLYSIFLFFKWFSGFSGQYSHFISETLEEFHVWMAEKGTNSYNEKMLVSQGGGAPHQRMRAWTCSLPPCTSSFPPLYSAFPDCRRWLLIFVRTLVVLNFTHSIVGDRRALVAGDSCAALAACA